MVAKELRDTWWKLLTAALAVVPALLIVAEYLPPYRSAGRVVEEFPPRIAMQQLWNVYSGGGIALGFLAALLGAALVSGETSQSTIFLLLSKPVGRARVLLAKYAVCAGVLLAVAVLGHVLFLAVAFVAKGYPPGLVSASSVILSSIVLWLGSLLVLGAALVASVAFRNVTTSIVAAALILVAYWFSASLGVGYWSSENLYAGRNLVPTYFLASVVAAVPLLIALWLFRRKAY